MKTLGSVAGSKQVLKEGEEPKSNLGQFQGSKRRQIEGVRKLSCLGFTVFGCSGPWYKYVVNLGSP